MALHIVQYNHWQPFNWQSILSELPWTKYSFVGFALKLGMILIAWLIDDINKFYKLSEAAWRIYESVNHH